MSNAAPIVPAAHRAHAATSTAAIGEAGAERLSRGVIWAYSLPRIGLGIMGLLFGTYLMKFSTDVLLIAPAAMGTLIAVSRLWDGVSDPMAGYLSDRTRSRVGRRRIWMFWAAVPMAVGLVMMWSPPLGLDGVWIIVWMGLALLVYETASTAFFIPHGAIGVELSPNYHERTRLFGWGHMIGAIGMMLGLISLQLMNMSEDKRTFRVRALGRRRRQRGGNHPVVDTALARARRLPGRGGQRVLESFADVFRNPHARLLLIVFGIETFGAILFARFRFNEREHARVRAALDARAG